jgi:EAL domain-containing protein (putative c-di-GMP-specific phosphodiesterase class I)
MRWMSICWRSTISRSILLRWESIISAEALLRLHHPQKGFISPVEFIPAAEHNGMIIRIGQFVLNEVCRMLKETDAVSCGIEYVEVNLSIVECIQSDLAENIDQNTGTQPCSSQTDQSGNYRVRGIAFRNDS